MQDAIAKAKILMQALPYIKEYSGKKVVIKYGGGAMEDPHLRQSVANDLALMHYVGIRPIVVHGGGPEISEYMKKQGKKVKFVDGLRVTDEETMEIVKMVLVGKVNKGIVDNINTHGNLAVGLSGDDGNLITAKKKEYEVDLGFVGDVTGINVDMLEKLIADGFIPVIATIGVDEKGNNYNINADTVAASVAEHLKSEKLIFLTDVNGLYAKVDEPDTLISVLSEEQARNHVAANKISGGMLPKVKACIASLEAGVHRTHILNGTIDHALLLEIFTDEGVGTMIS